MYKFWASILKESRLLLRDKVGLTLMFIMPILLALLITSIQISAFELVNNNKVKVLLFNQDKGELSKRNLIESPFTMLHPEGIRGVFKQNEIEEILILTEKLLAA